MALAGSPEGDSKTAMPPVLQLNVYLAIRFSQATIQLMSLRQ
jgi:hypothetical protein